MNTYRVWIRQINETYIDVKAKDSTDAFLKAKQQWREENGPEVRRVEEIDEKEVK